MRFGSCMSCLCFLSFLVLSNALPVAAASSVSSCIQEVNAGYQTCVSACKDTLQVNLDACRNVNHDCADACWTAYETCVEVPASDLRTCTAACDTTLGTAEKTCHSTYKKGTPELKSCLDTAEQAGIMCRATCRTNVQPEFSQCKLDFHACIKACPAAQ